MTEGSRRRAAIETAVMLAGAAAVIAAVRAPVALPGRLDFLVVPAFFLYAPLIVVLATDRDFAAMGVKTPLGRPLAVEFAVFALVVMPLFLAGWRVLYSVYAGEAPSPSFPARPASFVLWQFAAVAVPEEVFFRGFAQDRLNRLFPRRWRFLGAEIGPGLFMASALFALAHFAMRPRPVELLVFFPGLLFGLFRERSGSLVSPAAAHFTANVVFLALQGGL